MYSIKDPFTIETSFKEYPKFNNLRCFLTISLEFTPNILLNSSPWTSSFHPSRTIDSSIRQPRCYRPCIDNIHQPGMSTGLRGSHDEPAD